MESPFSSKVDPSEVYSSGLTVTPQAVEEAHNQGHVINDSSRVETLDQESQPVLLLHQEPRVVLPSMITNDIVQTSTDEPNDQAINSGIVDPYSSQLQTMIIQFPEGTMDNHILLKGPNPTDNVGSRERLSNTLVGFISQFINEVKRPVAIEEIITRVTPVFSHLRKMDGTKYKGNIVKAVNGALSSTGIFSRIDNGKWVIREEELKTYEQRTQKKIEAKGKRKRYQTNTEEDKQKRKYAKRKDRKRAIIQILDTISSSLQSENVERNSIYFQNPFMNCSCIDNCIALQRNLGPERFRLCMQLYGYFEDLFKVASGDIQYDLQHIVNTGNPINDKRIIQLWVEIDEIKGRMKALEKSLPKSLCIC